MIGLGQMDWLGWLQSSFSKKTASHISEQKVIFVCNYKYMRGSTFLYIFFVF